MKRIPDDLSIWIGLVGSGKTTTAAWAVHKVTHDKYYKGRLLPYTNFACVDAYQIDTKLDIGYSLISDALMVIDEAGIDYSNRNWKNNLTPEQNRFNRKFRHYNIEHYMFFSQYLDMDNTFIKLASSMHMTKKIGPFIIVNDYEKVIVFDENKQPQFGWEPVSILRGGLHFIYAPPYYKYFDSWERDDLPVKNFDLWQDVVYFRNYDYSKRKFYDNKVVAWIKSQIAKFKRS